MPRWYLRHLGKKRLNSHCDIDERSLALARAIAVKIDDDASKQGLSTAVETCARWLSLTDSPACREWQEILARPWTEIRRVLLDESEEGRRLRQSSPFCGILTPQERWSIYDSFSNAA